MDPKFVNANDVQMRLDGGIVWHDGLPKLAYYSPSDSCETQICMYRMGEHDEIGEKIDANDPSVHTKTLDVGYMNTRRIHSYVNDDYNKPVYRRLAGFVYRGTNRKQKSVLHTSNVYIHYCGQNVPTGIGDNFSSGFFRDMLLNEYPKFRDFSTIERGESVAFSRNFAVSTTSKDHRLYFNGHEIGKKRFSDSAFSLEPGYDHSIMVMRLAALNIPV